MPQVKPNVVARVDLTEYERGWGSKVFDSIYFDSWDEAVAYAREHNSQNTEAVAPDYYTVASTHPI